MPPDDTKFYISGLNRRSAAPLSTTEPNGLGKRIFNVMETVMNKLLASALVSLGLITAAPLVMAQTAAPESPAPSARPGPRAEHAPRHHVRHASFQPAARVAARLAYIRTALQITPAQEPQWDAFANVLRKQAAEAEHWIKARRAKRTQEPRHAHITAIERLERREKMVSIAAQRLNEVITAAKPLYAVLSPAQRHIADGLMAKQAHGRFAHRGWHRHGA